MKKLLLIIAVAFGIIVSNNQSKAQAVGEGNMIVDVYYGFPNLFTTLFKTTYANSGAEEDLKFGGIGPFGGRFEYMVADKVGVGVDVHFNNSTIGYTEGGYDYNFKTQKLSAMATFNYHFVQSSDVFDGYLEVGAGYGNRTFNFTSTDPDFKPNNTLSSIPVALRIAVGGRYFITDNIGINMAIGLGGPLVSGGLSFKF